MSSGANCLPTFVFRFALCHQSLDPNKSKTRKRVAHTHWAETYPDGASPERERFLWELIPRQILKTANYHPSQLPFCYVQYVSRLQFTLVHWPTTNQFVRSFCRQKSSVNTSSLDDKLWEASKRGNINIAHEAAMRGEPRSKREVSKQRSSTKGKHLPNSGLTVNISLGLIGL